MVINLRIRLILIVLLAVLPALVLILFTSLEQHRMSESEAGDDLVRTVQLISKGQEHMIGAGRQLLAALARLPAVRDSDVSACTSVLADLLSEYPVFADLGVIFPDGSVFCSAMPLRGTVNVSDHSSFQQATSTRSFSVGDFQAECTTAGACVNLVYPVLDEAGKIHVVLYAALRLSWLANLAAHAGLPGGSTFGIIDRNGAILAHYPQPEQWVGRNVQEERLAKTILTQGSGVTRAPDPDGTLRVLAFAPLTGGLPEGFMYAGIPSKAVFAKADHALRRNLAILTGVTFLVLSIGWVFDHLFILKRIECLIGTTGRLARGDFEARADLFCGKGELGRLACSLDTMAENLHFREMERDRAQFDLRETLQTLEAVFLASPAAIAALDSDGLVRLWNPAAERTFGWTAKEVIGRPLPVLSNDDKEEARHLQALLLSGSAMANLELTRESKDGSLIEVSLSAAPLYDAEGARKGVVAIFVDISELKLGIESLRRARDELEERVDQRTTDLTKVNEELRIEITEREHVEAALRKTSEGLKFFAYSVIHDLKSPAIGMYGLTRLLRKQYGDQLDERGKNYCEQILAASEHFGTLIEKINAYIATKESNLKIETISFDEICRILREEFSLRLTLHQIAWKEPSHPIEIKADRISLLRTLRNLVDNALKYGGEGLNEIRVGHEESEQFHILSVSDNGMGIAEQDRQTLFGLFQRHGTSKGVDGAGLGLAIVKEVADRHGGTAWVESSSEGGTTFSVSLSKNL